MHSRYKLFLDINIPYLYSYYTNMIDKFLNDFKQNPTAEKYQNVSIVKAFESDDYNIINLIDQFDPSRQIELDSFVVSHVADFLHSVRHNYHKELIFDILIGGQFVWSATIKPDSIECIFGGMPLLLININFSLVRFIIRDDDQIVCTNQLQLTLYYGAIIDSSYRRFIAQNPPYCKTKEGYYLHQNYILDSDERDLFVKRNQIFYPYKTQS